MRLCTVLANKVKTMSSKNLPLFLEGEVVKGFGRGSKDIGCPTANYSQSVVQSLPPELLPGVYYGWAQVDSGPIHKMVANIGWCPMYQNKDMSVETHIYSHKFDKDFYGSYLKIGILGYLRGEINFPSLEDLKQQIKQDIADADVYLEQAEAKTILCHKFFTS